VKFGTNAKQRCFRAQKKTENIQICGGLQIQTTALDTIKDLVSSQQKVGEKFLYLTNV